MIKDFIQMFGIRLWILNRAGWLLAFVLILVGLTVALPAALIKRHKKKSCDKNKVIL